MLRTRAFTGLMALGLSARLLFGQVPQPGESPVKPDATHPAPDKKPGDPKVEPSPDQLLRYQHKVGDSHTYKITTSLVHQQTSGQPPVTRETNCEREDLVTLSVKELDEKGFALCSLRIDALRANVRLNGQQYKFDSKSKTRQDSPPIARSLNPLFDRLAGGEYQLLIGPQGEVDEVRGYAELLRDVLVDNPLAMQLAGGGFNNSARVFHGEQTVVFGNQVVKPGEKWEVPIDLEAPSVGRARGRKTCTLVGPDKLGDRETLRINVATDITYDVVIATEAVRVTGQMATVESTGLAHFDKSAGRLLSLKASWKLAGKLTAIAGGRPFEIQNDQVHSVGVELVR